MKTLPMRIISNHSQRPQPGHTSCSHIYPKAVGFEHISKDEPFIELYSIRVYNFTSKDRNCIGPANLLQIP